MTQDENLRRKKGTGGNNPTKLTSSQVVSRYRLSRSFIFQLDHLSVPPPGTSHEQTKVSGDCNVQTQAIFRGYHVLFSASSERK